MPSLAGTQSGAAPEAADVAMEDAAPAPSGPLLDDLHSDAADSAGCDEQPVTHTSSVVASHPASAADGGEAPEGEAPYFDAGDKAADGEGRGGCG